jgi:uncharacterized RDD family membrane protein YckC
MSTANSFRRFFAYIVDKVVIFFLYFFLYLPVWIQISVSWLADRTFEIRWHWLIICFLLQFAYRWCFLKTLGGTLGKLLMGLRLVNRRTGEPLSWMQAFLRVLTDQLSLLFGPAHQMLLFARFDRTHLADWVAETQVRQLAENSAQPKRNIPMAIFLCLYFALTSYLSIYQLVQRSEWSSQSLIVHAKNNSE